MNSRSFAPVIVAIGGVILLGGCRQMPANETTKVSAASANEAIAIYAYTDGPYAETVALLANGKYLETPSISIKPPVFQSPTTRLPLPDPSPATFPPGRAHTSTWRLLDKPDGSPLSWPASPTLLPPDAVVELKDALVFGLVFESSPSYGGVTRTLPAREFTLKTTPR